MKKVSIILLILIGVACQKHPENDYRQLEGLAFGTSFHINMEDPDRLVTEKAIDSLIHVFNKSLSTYIPNSDISRINRGDSSVVVDAYFKEVFAKSSKINRETEGAFDPTIGILVNAWGFGPGKELSQIDHHKVDSLLVYVGFDQLELKGDRLIKKHEETQLDFNANAKGLAVDVIGRYLEGHGIKNYLVEIGGEIRARGNNPSGVLWRVAIEEPNFDGSRSFQTIIVLDNESIATSGSYRKFKVDPETGEKYAHTIDSKTGYPSKSNLLSASVIGSIDCADTDAYATAFMSMGFDKSVDFSKNRPDLRIFLIYSDPEGQIKTYSSPNFDKNY